MNIEQILAINFLPLNFNLSKNKYKDKDKGIPKAQDIIPLIIKILLEFIWLKSFIYILKKVAMKEKRRVTGNLDNEIKASLNLSFKIILFKYIYIPLKKLTLLKIYF